MGSDPQAPSLHGESSIVKAILPGYVKKVMSVELGAGENHWRF